MKTTFLRSLLVTVVLCVVATHAYIRVPGSDDLFLTPFGYLPKACVHEVPSDATVLESPTGEGLMVTLVDGVTSFVLPRCEDFLGAKNQLSLSARTASRSLSSSSRKLMQSFPDGWAAYTQYQLTNPCQVFNGQWTVPAVPAAQDSQTVFLFTGLQNSDSTGAIYILQPVLTWGFSDAGGGNYWSIASWFVGSDGSAVFSTPVQVAAGDTIVGQMLYNSTATNWKTVSYDSTTGVTSNLNTKYNVSELFAFVTLEVYSIASCNDYPTGSVAFSNLLIKDTTGPITPVWESSTQTGCNEAVNIVDSSDVTIVF